MSYTMALNMEIEMKLVDRWEPQFCLLVPWKTLSISTLVVASRVHPSTLRFSLVNTVFLQHFYGANDIWIWLRLTNILSDTQSFSVFFRRVSVWHISWLDVVVFHANCNKQFRINSRNFLRAWKHVGFSVWSKSTCAHCSSKNPKLYIICRMYWNQINRSIISSSQNYQS